LEGLTEHPDGHFTWGEPHDGGTVFGSIDIRDGKLKLECNSKSRLEVGRQLLERHAGQYMTHMADSFSPLDLEKLKKGASAGAGKLPESGIPPEVEREVVLQFKNQHYSKWLDMRLPALQQKSPREAVGTPSGREAVTALLRTLEHDEELERRAGRPAFDVGPLWEALGLSR
jgi:hypothetical protein